MIIRGQDNGYIVIKQHDHAAVSYQLATYWKDSNFQFPTWKRQVLDAIKNHDRGWIPLDTSILWNDENNQPYDFNSYPLEKKLHAYRQGINEVEDVNPYGAILCSKHYTSFFAEGSANQTINKFIKDEQKRRNHLIKHLQLNNAEHMLSQHLKLLQFCDDLSLYSCINKPGTEKDEEWPWFRNGFRQSFFFISEPIQAFWLDTSTIKVVPFPFSNPITVCLPYYKIKQRQEKLSTYYELQLTIVPE